MNSETESLDSAAARLEAALERIALAAVAPPPEPDRSKAEIAAALDRIITRLRAALDGAE